MSELLERIAARRAALHDPAPPIVDMLLEDIDPEPGVIAAICEPLDTANPWLPVELDELDHGKPMPRDWWGIVASVAVSIAGARMAEQYNNRPGAVENKVGGFMDKMAARGERQKAEAAAKEIEYVRKAVEKAEKTGKERHVARAEKLVAMIAETGGKQAVQEAVKGTKVEAEMRSAGTWDESLHPRDNAGQFAAMVARVAGPTNADWWESGSGIDWGAEGSFTECVGIASGKVDDPEAFCATRYHEATGEWPGAKHAATAASARAITAAYTNASCAWSFAIARSADVVVEAITAGVVQVVAAQHAQRIANEQPAQPQQPKYEPPSRWVGELVEAARSSVERAEKSGKARHMEKAEALLAQVAKDAGKAGVQEAVKGTNVEQEMRASGTWDESLHPRDNAGMFASFDQPRDEWGRFAESGGGGGVGESRVEENVTRDMIERSAPKTPDDGGKFAGDLSKPERTLVEAAVERHADAREAKAIAEKLADQRPLDRAELHTVKDSVSALAKDAGALVKADPDKSGGSLQAQVMRVGAIDAKVRDAIDKLDDTKAHRDPFFLLGRTSAAYEQARDELGRFTSDGGGAAAEGERYADAHGWKENPPVDKPGSAAEGERYADAHGWKDNPPVHDVKGDGGGSALDRREQAEKAPSAETIKALRELDAQLPAGPSALDRREAAEKAAGYHPGGTAPAYRGDADKSKALAEERIGGAHDRTDAELKRLFGRTASDQPRDELGRFAESDSGGMGSGSRIEAGGGWSRSGGQNEGSGWRSPDAPVMYEPAAKGSDEPWTPRDTGGVIYKDSMTAEREAHDAAIFAEPKTSENSGVSDPAAGAAGEWRSGTTNEAFGVTAEEETRVNAEGQMESKVEAPLFGGEFVTQGGSAAEMYEQMTKGVEVNLAVAGYNVMHSGMSDEKAGVAEAREALKPIVEKELSIHDMVFRDKDEVEQLGGRMGTRAYADAMRGDQHGAVVFHAGEHVFVTDEKLKRGEYPTTQDTTGGF